MSRFFCLLLKDFRNACFATPPAILLGLPILLILGFGNEIEKAQDLHWRSAFWLSLFLTSSALFYRSFGQEQRFRNFQIYKALNIRPQLVFWSQAFILFLSLLVVGAFYLGTSYMLFSPEPGSFRIIELLGILVLSAAAICPLASLLSIGLQLEREFLFSLFFLPLISPVILGAHEMSAGGSKAWGAILCIYLLISGFVSALLFEFFFDELSELD